ncbi:hypothetical protein VTN02DRAFT_1153 [Thermoascus thermophilus]
MNVAKGRGRSSQSAGARVRPSRPRSAVCLNRPLGSVAGLVVCHPPWTLENPSDPRGRDMVTDDRPLLEGCRGSHNSSVKLASDLLRHEEHEHHMPWVGIWFQGLQLHAVS